MVKLNGMVKWMIIAITLITIGVGIVVGYTRLEHQTEDNCEDIAIIEPKVEKNTEYRLKAEVDTIYMKEKLRDISDVQQVILEEVRK